MIETNDHSITFLMQIFALWQQLFFKFLEIILEEIPKKMQNNFKNSPNFQNHKIEKENPMTTSQCQQGVCHTVALPFTLKSILRQKKDYENSNISPCENIIFKKSSKRNQNPSQYLNSITNLKFQHKPKYHLSKILIQK